MGQEDSPELPVIPVVKQPAGIRYYLGTWSGRILVINFIVFAWMVFQQPSSLWIPSVEYVREFGSKSLSDIALGEYWRFISPVFVHIGIIHFFFNAMAMYYIGYQIEYILGAKWFLIVYLTAGIVGNLASCVFSLAPSAGASGALFGLLGAGFRLEGLLSDAFDRQGIAKKPRRKIYSGLVVTNIILGLIIPVIDNSAHLGGLISGWLLTEAMLRTKPNRLRQQNKILAYAIYFAVFTFAVGSIASSSNKKWVVRRYTEAGMKADSAPEAYADFTEALRVSPMDPKARMYRGQLLLQAGETDRGVEDLKLAISTGQITDADFDRVVENLEMTGHRLEAELARKLKEDARNDQGI